MPDGTRRIFVDSNILLYSLNPRLPQHAHALALLTGFWGQGVELVISTQVLNEYLAVSTGRLREHGRQMAIEAAAGLRTSFTVLEQTTDVFHKLVILLRDQHSDGSRVYDANIVATMLVNGIDELLTNNVKDFKPFEGLINILPFDSAI